MEKKLKETRGRKPLPDGEKIVFIRVGVKQKHRKELQKVIDNLKKAFT
jgi:hypothetical protein